MFPVILLAAAAATAPDHSMRIDYLRHGLDKTLASLEAKAKKPGASITTRDLTNGAMGELILHADGKRAAELLRLAFNTQDMDPQSKHFGMLPWETTNREISDMNAIEFGTESMGPILLHYKDKPPAGFVDELLPHLRAAFVALDRHDVKVSYTNIFLMKTVNMILIAEALKDSAVEAKGRKQLDADSIEMDGEKVDVKSPFRKYGVPISVVAVREGNAIAVLRIFMADAAGGAETHFVLQAEAHGLKYNALRYTAYHYRGDSRKLTEKHVKVGILAYITTCSSEKECAEAVDRVKSAHIENQSDARAWTVKARLGDTHLAASRDLDHRKILWRQVNGQPFGARYPLLIDGKPVELNAALQ